MNFPDGREMTSWDYGDTLAVFTGDPEATHEAYLNVVATLGVVGTATLVERVIDTAQPGGRTIRASLSYISPPQEAIVLTTGDGDNTSRGNLKQEAKYDDAGHPYRRDYAVVYDATAVPPVLKIIDASSSAEPLPSEVQERLKTTEAGAWTFTQHPVGIYGDTERTPAT